MLLTAYNRLRASYDSAVSKLMTRQSGQGELQACCEFTNRSVVLWDPVVGLGTIVHQHGKRVHTMGRLVHDKVLLFAEEVVFLAERAKVAVIVGDQEIPVKTLFSLVISSSHEPSKKRERNNVVPLPCLPCYWVYAHLRSLGYVVYRVFAQSSTTSNATTPALWDSKVAQGVSVLSYEVYRPSTSLREASPPAFYVIVTSYASVLPPIPTLMRTLTETNGVHLKVAVVSSDSTVLMFDVSQNISRLT
mmetsp:Transcript_11842/g.35567  ORF Transcript_11842/g.35567 Transcript_11842/m.35567 type:complete len:247 (-) Transcript_11842:1960-2700(-)